MALKKPYAAGKVAVNRPLRLGQQADISINVGTPMEQRLLTGVVENFWVSDLDNSIRITTAHSIYEGHVLEETKANAQGAAAVLASGVPQMPDLGTALNYLDAQMQQAPGMQAAQQMPDLGTALNYLDAQMQQIAQY